MRLRRSARLAWPGLRAPRALASLAIVAAVATGQLALVLFGPSVAPVRAGTTGNCGGCIVMWGGNSAHQLDFPDAVQGGVVAISAAGKMAMALHWDGHVFAWGDNTYGQATVPAGLYGVAAIAAGGNFAVALKATGEVIVWGDNDYGQRNVPDAAKHGVVRIAAGANAIIAVKSDGSVVGWGNNSYHQLDAWSRRVSGPFATPTPYKNLKSVSLSYHGLAITSASYVVAWGQNTSGETTVPSTVGTATAVAAGSNFSLALRSDGAIVGWGDNTDGQLNYPCLKTALSGCGVAIKGYTAIAAGDHHALAVKDGNVVTWGSKSPAAQGKKLDGGMYLAVAAGADFSMALWDKPQATSAPANVTASAGDGAAQVAWDEAATNGFYALTYKATSSPGGKTCDVDATKLTCVVSGLTNGTTYTFTVTATNAIGTSKPSAPSNAVTPMVGKVMSLVVHTPAPSGSSGAASASASAGPSTAATATASASAAATDSGSPAATGSPSPGGSGSGGSGGVPLPLILAIGAVVVIGGGAAALLLKPRLR